MREVMTRRTDTDLFASSLRDVLGWACYRLTSRLGNAYEALTRRWKEVIRPGISAHVTRAYAPVRATGRRAVGVANRVRASFVRDGPAAQRRIEEQTASYTA